jgi:hypothetical protein
VSRSWGHVAAAAVAVAALTELILANDGGYTFYAVAPAAGVIAAGIWASIAFAVKRRLAARKKPA